jgi:hypothetical protein
MLRRPVLGLCWIGIGAACLAASGDDGSVRQVESDHTQLVNFPAGGLLSLAHSTGDLHIEGWDLPELEITTIESTKKYDPRNKDAAEKSLNRIRVTMLRRGNEITITTKFPRHFLLARPFKGVSPFEMQYAIKAPRWARLAIAHDSGNVYVSGFTGDIQARNGSGQITLHVPENGRYAIDAKSNFGAVNSDFSGPKRGNLIGRALLTKAPPGAQKLFARIGFGDIVILKIRKPQSPGPIRP